eukprot:TRINITY_DN5859_c0_g1_i3.p1 TRINITY_DN5859_c0_g1~~TRINITY_DN5859_c0_g1_i3.p1  ORF type:complete len:1006 (-),score=161.82 TRINITY_DN5859_c0_g1_i3:110-3127(-)
MQGSGVVEDEDEEPSCRICRQGKEDGKLYCPCRCAGSIKWIHGECLQEWLRSQGRSHERKPVCELCGYCFDFVPVYSANAPERLTAADWAGAFYSSAISVGRRCSRIIYAVALWGFLLPLLTMMATRCIFGRSAMPDLQSAWHVLPLTIVVGECLSLAGIAFIYLLSLLSAARGVADGDEAAAEGAETAAPAPSPEAFVAPAPLSPSLAAPGEPVAPALVNGELQQEDMDLEDLWNIMGLQGPILRSFLSMLTFLCANVGGICIFLALPTYIGRFAMGLLLRWLKALAPETIALMLQFVMWIPSESARDLVLRQSFQLPAAGANTLLDIVLLIFGYAVSAYLLVLMVLAALLFGVATGIGNSSYGWQALRSMADMARVQLQDLYWQGWARLQMLAVVVLQLVVFPSYIGHLVICLLCGPMLHLSQHARASIVSTNPTVTMVMQLFIGYVHLWGAAFIEGSLVDVLVPAVVQRASANFYIGAITSHRRLFGTGSEDPAGLGDSPPMPPHWATLKVALVHVAIHTPLAFILWYFPAVVLDRFFGEALFPMQLNDPPGADSAQPLDPLFSGPAREYAVGMFRSASSKNGVDGQSIFVLELMQLYVLVLQCIRILEASPVLSTVMNGMLRCVLRNLGLGHLLAPVPPAAVTAAGSVAAPTPFVPGARTTAAPEAETPVAAAPHCASEAMAKASLPLSLERWAGRWALACRVLAVSGLLLVFCWVTMMLVLALPLSLGRLIVRCISPTQAKRISDFLPLSMGVIIASTVILITVKLAEAAPAILEQMSTLGRHRFLHVLACSISAVGIAVAVLAVLPLGLGTLLLRLVLPLKVHTVYQVPIIFLLTDCWSLGLVLTNVVWRLIQTDMAMHALHREIMSLWAEAQGSVTNIFLDLRAHSRIWRTSVLPMLEIVVFHLVFPRTAALTLVHWLGPSKEYLSAALLMYCYHLVLVVRFWFVAMPMMKLWLKDIRQQIFDGKYLEKTELQNYHPDSLSDSAASPLDRDTMSPPAE